jgi:hypothetical protein
VRFVSSPDKVGNLGRVSKVSSLVRAPATCLQQSSIARGIFLECYLPCTKTFTKSVTSQTKFVFLDLLGLREQGLVGQLHDLHPPLLLRLMGGLAILDLFVAHLLNSVYDPVALDFDAGGSVGEGCGALGAVQEEAVTTWTLATTTPYPGLKTYGNPDIVIPR